MDRHLFITVPSRQCLTQHQRMLSPTGLLLLSSLMPGLRGGVVATAQWVAPLECQTPPPVGPGSGIDGEVLAISWVSGAGS